MTLQEAIQILRIEQGVTEIEIEQGFCGKSGYDFIEAVNVVLEELGRDKN